MVVTESQQNRLDLTFSALSSPIRRKMLTILKTGDITVTDLSKSFKDISMQGIVKHLKVLEKAGLIVRSKDRQTRPSRLEGQPLREALEWLAEYRQFWNQSFDKLESFLDEIQN